MKISETYQCEVTGKELVVKAGRFPEQAGIGKLILQTTSGTIQYECVCPEVGERVYTAVVKVIERLRGGYGEKVKDNILPFSNGVLQDGTKPERMR